MSVEMSSHENGADENESKFYADAKKYWDQVPATVDGMLGGFSQISSTDIAGSSKFLKPFLKGAGTQSHRALDCGAGIGRITKRLLLPLFETVDMVELSRNFLDEAPRFLGEDNAARVERFICSGLQDFVPESGRYDVIWCQWVLGHLTDDDLEAFFRRCKLGLSSGGIIVVKENVARTKENDFDADDSSYTRPRQVILDIAKRAELCLLREEKQKSFPRDLYEVRMFALQ